MKNKTISTTEFLRRLKIKITQNLNAIAKKNGYSDWNCYSSIELGIVPKEKKDD